MSNGLGMAFANVMTKLADVEFKKDGSANGRKYITLDAINRELLPSLRGEDLTFVVHRDENQNFWGTLLYLKTMEEYSKCFGRIDMNENKGMNSAQAQGASLSYGRRYVTTCFFNLIVDEDTDGNIPQGGGSKQFQAQKPRDVQQDDFQKLENFNNSTVQISAIDILKPTEKGDKMICSVKTLDKKSTLAYPDIVKNGVKLSNWDLKFEAIKNLIRFGKNLTIKISSKAQNDFGINEQSAPVLLEEAHKKNHTLILQGINDQKPSLPAPPIGSPEANSIPF